MDRVVIVSKPSRLTELERVYQTRGAARFAVESLGQSFAEYEREHQAYDAALVTIRKQIPNDFRVAQVSREELPGFLFRDNDLVIVSGPDGLFANVAKYLKDQLVLTVNPDIRSVAGALMLFSPDQVGAMIVKVTNGTARTESLPFVKAAIDGEKVVWGINDVFVGHARHGSARYAASFAGRTERQSSSGVIVSTGLGSTGWMRSIAAMVNGLMNQQGTHLLSRLPRATSDELVFVVREPFPSHTTGASLVTGRVRPGSPLVLVSEMPTDGCVFSDGVIEETVAWNAGSTVTISIGERYVQRIIPD